MAAADFPPEPDEERLHVETAILDSFTKLQVSAYTSLKDHFGLEAPREKHPVPTNPGTNGDEQEDLQYLSWWSDSRGSGWKVTYSKGQLKYFSVGKWGSWRLAFILARLQRDVWAKRQQPAQESLDHSRPAAHAPPVPRKPKRAQSQPLQPQAVSAEIAATPTETLAELQMAPTNPTLRGCAIQGEKQLPAKRRRRLVENDSPNSNKIKHKHAADPHDSPGKRVQREQEKGSHVPPSLALEKVQCSLVTRSKAVAFTGFPLEPVEPRFTVKGAIVSDGGKLEVKDYLDLRDHFADEAPREQHPVPLKPGVKQEEQEQVENLRWWSDAKGEGWIAKGPSMGTVTKDKWFSVKTCGSWRLAFLMARLQRDVWLSGMHIEAAIENVRQASGSL